MSDNKETGSKYFQSLVENAGKSEEGDDPYALEKFGAEKKESRLQVKWNRIKNQLGGKEGVPQKFLMGLQMGFTVGGIFGTLIGCVAFYKTRQFLYIPISALSMGASFGFFLGVGTVVRSDDSECDMKQRILVKEEGVWKLKVTEEAWKAKYKLENSY